jgi:predicted metalloenzyme YecM
MSIKKVNNTLFDGKPIRLVALKAPSGLRDIFDVEKFPYPKRKVSAERFGGSRSDQSTSFA